MPADHLPNALERLNRGQATPDDIHIEARFEGIGVWLFQRAQMR